MRQHPFHRFDRFDESEILFVSSSSRRGSVSLPVHQPFVHQRIFAAISSRWNASNLFVLEKASRNAFGVINGANRGSVSPIFLSIKRSRFAAAAWRSSFRFRGVDLEGPRAHGRFCVCGTLD
jgi:hypothetical protein